MKGYVAPLLILSVLSCSLVTVKPTVPPRLGADGRRLQETFFVSTCGMELKSALELPQFLFYAVPALVQAWFAPGNVRARYLPFDGFSLTSHRTLSAWRTEEDLMNFIRNGAHARAVENIPRFAVSARSLRLEMSDIPTFSEILPIWEEDASFVFGGDSGVERHF